MFRILLVAAVIVSLLAFAKKNEWFERAGVVGTCTEIAAPRGDEAQWWSCKQGVLTGYPSLRRDSCDPQGTRSQRQFWRCTTPLTSSPGGL
jgi:hypothetical protein